MRQVNRHAGSFLARRDWPGVHDLVRPGVNRDQFVLVFDIVIDTSGLRVGGGKFRLSGQRDGGNNLA